MRKIIFLLLVFCALFTIGCERMPKVISFQNATLAGSDSNTVKVIITQDKMYQDKCYDIWIKSDKSLTVKVNYENEQEFNISFEKKDYWYSLTDLEYASKNLKGTEDYKNFKEALNKTIIFKTETECNLTFKGVIGDKVKNAEEKGYVFANAEDVSKEYTQKMTPLKQNDQ